MLGYAESSLSGQRVPVRRRDADAHRAAADFDLIALRFGRPPIFQQRLWRRCTIGDRHRLRVGFFFIDGRCTVSERSGRRTNMPIWRLDPIHPDDHHWRASTYTRPLSVRAADEIKARSWLGPGGPVPQRPGATRQRPGQVPRGRAPRQAGAGDPGEILGPRPSGPSHERAWRATPACYWEPVDPPKQ